MLERCGAQPSAGRAPASRPPTRSAIARMWSGVVPQQLTAVRHDRHPRLERQRPSDQLEPPARAEHGSPHLQDVLRGLDDQEVRSAYHGLARLLSEDVDQLVEADLTKGRIV